MGEAFLSFVGGFVAGTLVYGWRAMTRKRAIEAAKRQHAVAVLQRVEAARRRLIGDDYEREDWS